VSTSERKPRQYGPEFRIQAAKLILEEGISATQAAKDLGVPLATMHTWAKRFRSGEWDKERESAKASLNLSTEKKISLPQKIYAQLTEEQKKVAELERQLKRMTMERDILKKAMAYCMDVPK
jgi:transposase